MKTIIVISCFLANGTHHEPRGQYDNFPTCDRWVGKFERQVFPSEGERRPLCWCHRRLVEVPPLPERREPEATVGEPAETLK